MILKIGAAIKSEPNIPH